MRQPGVFPKAAQRPGSARVAILASGMAFCLWCSCLLTQAQEGLVISEFLAMNAETIRDDFGESSDYVEIYNGTLSSINLGGYYLTDSLDRKTQWQFPSTNLASGAYLLVWASGHDRRTPGKPLHTNFKLDGNGEALALIQPDQITVIHQFTFGQQILDRTFGLEAEVTGFVPVLPQGAPSRYFAPASDALGNLWTLPGFDDSGWRLGASGFGFDTNTTSVFSPLITTDVKDILAGASPKRAGLFIRIPFLVENPATLANVALRMRYDDGFVAYLNGTEVTRQGIAPNASPSFSTTSSLSRSNDLAIVPEDFASLALTQGLRAGTNVLAIHAFNRDPGDGDFLIVPEVVSRQLRYRTNAERYFAIPSPGFANSTGYPGASGSLEFSVKSRTFTESFDLVITPAMQAPLAEIRYTLDGSVPGTNSLLYKGPLAVTNSLQIRARLFEPGLLPGVVRTEAYARLAPEMLSVSSDLPLILVHSYGIGNFTEAQSKACILFVHEPRRGRASFTNAPDMVFRAGLKLRGSASVGNLKYNWAVDCWDEYDRDMDLPLLGLPSGAEWVFHAPYLTDISLINNPMASAMSLAAGRYAPHYAFAELYLNQRPGSQSTAMVAPTNYFGVYNILQRIGIGPNRVDIDKLTDQDVRPPEVTGGYLMNIDRNIDGPDGFPAAGQTVNYITPRYDEMISPQREPQRTYLAGYFESFGAALNSASWTNPVTGYAPFVDVGSWIDFHLVNVIAFNGDGTANSTFFYKTRNGPFVFGPVWDFDKAFAWADGLDPGVSWDPGRGAFGAPWWGRMFQDPNFSQAYIDRFQELEAGPYGIPEIRGLVDRLGAQVKESADRDMVRWKQPKRGGSQDGEIAFFKDWISRRIHFMDTNFVARPDILERQGQVNSGAQVSIAGPPGATIYYTLDGSDPRAMHGGIASNAIVYTGPIPITRETRLVARSRDQNHGDPAVAVSVPPVGSPWSGPARARYILEAPASEGDLVVSELNYHPSAPTAKELSTRSGLTPGDFEFIEIQNVTGHTVDLFGCRFTQGVTFDFRNATLSALGPGERLLLVKNPAAMAVRYGALSNIAGIYTGSLANERQTLRLEDSEGKPLFEFAYAGRWHPPANGLGFTLVRRDLLSKNSSREAWGPSSGPLGSPGRENPPPAQLPRVVINEVLANSEAPFTDTIELLNTSNVAADISGWYLTDDPGQPWKYQIPDKTILPPSSFWVANETVFASRAQGTNAFQLSSGGDEVWLFAADRAGALLGYSHGFQFGASESNTSWGRYVPREGEEQLVPQRLLTLGTTNAGPKIGPVIIREFLYHPRDLYENGAFWDNDEDEFIEIQNISNTPVMFEDAASGAPWLLRGTVGFDFPRTFILETNQSTVLVSFDPGQQPARMTAWRQKWALSASIPVLGPFRGKMDNSGGELKLLKPGPINGASGDISYVVVDRVMYRDTAPWPAAADGGGASLERKPGSVFGNDADSWIAALPSPGRNPVTGNIPSITAQPASQTVIAGTRVVFNAKAAAGPSALYQWRRNGLNVPAATNAQLILDPVELNDAGQYSLVVVNENGSIESSPATLKVLRPATIVRQPESQNIKPGSGVTFAVAATGRGALTYQWSFNGAPIPGATASAYSLSNAQGTNTGLYTVRVTDSTGSALSKPAQLNVLVKPAFTVQPQQLLAVVGDAVELRVEVTGLAPLAYRCRKGASVIPGATNAVLSLKNVQMSDAGSYLVIVTNLASGTLGVFSQSATMVVMNDADRDRVGDEWETQFGYSPNAAADASRDDDGDGQTTLQEFIAGTDPRNAQSVLRIDSIHLSPQGLELSFTAQPNRGYTVQFRESLASGSWQTLRQVNSRDVARPELVMDSFSQSNARWYRLVTPQQF